MATTFLGEGNIGTKPEFKEFPNGNKDPRRLLRLNVYFDNSIPNSSGVARRSSCSFVSECSRPTSR